MGEWPGTGEDPLLDPQKTALITGASAGLGREFARQLAERGLDLILVARRKAQLEALARELEAQFPIRVEVLALDLSRTKAAKELVQNLDARDLCVDVLINNAGIGGPDFLDHRHWRDHQKFMQLMMATPAELCHLLIPPMIERGGGGVLNVASVAGRAPCPQGEHYGAVKAYLIALSENLALRLADKGVRVSALCPGFTHTDFHLSKELAELKEGTPDWIWYDAKTVVRDGLEALEAGRSVSISGRLYRWVDPILQSAWVRPWIRRALTRGARS